MEKIIQEVNFDFWNNIEFIEQRISDYLRFISNLELGVDNDIINEAIFDLKRYQKRLRELKKIEIRPINYLYHENRPLE